MTAKRNPPREGERAGRDSSYIIQYNIISFDSIFSPIFSVLYLDTLEAAVDEVAVENVLVRLRWEIVMVQQVDQVGQLSVEVSDLFGKMFSFLDWSETPPE